MNYLFLHAASLLRTPFVSIKNKGRKCLFFAECWWYRWFFFLCLGLGCGWYCQQKETELRRGTRSDDKRKKKVATAFFLFSSILFIPCFLPTFYALLLLNSRHAQPTTILDYLIAQLPLLFFLQFIIFSTIV